VDFESGHKDLFNFIRLKYRLEKLLKRRILSEVQDAW